MAAQAEWVSEQPSSRRRGELALLLSLGRDLPRCVWIVKDIENSALIVPSLLLFSQISRRAQVGWSTAGHSGVDVNLYAYGYNATGLAGNRENTEIGKFIEHALGVELSGEFKYPFRRSAVADRPSLSHSLLQSSLWSSTSEYTSIFPICSGCTH